MPRVIINGSLAPVNKPTEVDFDPNRGLVMHLAYESAGANLGGLANTFINSGVAFRWVNSGVKSRLDATVSGGTSGLPDLAQVNWQLLANEAQVSIFESGVALFTEAAFPGTISAIRSSFQAMQSGDPDGADAIRDTVDAGALGDYDALLGLLLRGTTHYASGQYALKRSYTVSNFYSGAVPGQGLDEFILSTAEILSLGPPSTIGGIIASISAPASPDNYLWGWRQLPSTAVTTAQNRVEISTEWWADRWSTLLYGIA